MTKYDFDFVFVGYDSFFAFADQYPILDVIYTSPVTGKSWRSRASKFILSNPLSYDWNPSTRELEGLKRLCKRGERVEFNTESGEWVSLG